MDYLNISQRNFVTNLFYKERPNEVRTDIDETSISDRAAFNTMVLRFMGELYNQSKDTFYAEFHILINYRKFQSTRLNL